MGDLARLVDTECADKAQNAFCVLTAKVRRGAGIESGIRGPGTGIRKPKAGYRKDRSIQAGDNGAGTVGAGGDGAQDFFVLLVDGGAPTFSKLNESRMIAV